MAKNPYPSELADRFQIRMPEGLRARVAEAAKANNRSMNAEIVARIEQSFDNEGAFPEAAKVLLSLEEELTESLKAQREIAAYFRDQVAGMSEIIELIADSDGHLDEGFHKALKVLVSTKGKGSVPALDALASRAKSRPTKPLP